MMPQDHYMILAKKHLSWLAGKGSFVALDSVKRPWKKERKAWLYKSFHPSHCLREMLPGEVVLEFDGYVGQTKEESRTLAHATCQRLDTASIAYIMFDHQGKSPHIHVFIEGLAELTIEQRKSYKERFVHKYSADPAKTDMSLCGEHLIACEYLHHWKYGHLKLEVRNMLVKHKIDGCLQLECARCGLRRCEYVDERGIFYCTLCVEKMEAKV